MKKFVLHAHSDMEQSLPVFEGTPEEESAEGHRVAREQLVDELGLADVLTPEVFAAGDVLITQAFQEEFPELVPDATSGVTGARGMAVPVAAPQIVARLQEAPPILGLHTAPSWASSGLSHLWANAETTCGEVSSEPQFGTKTIKDERRGITAITRSSSNRQGRPELGPDGLRNYTWTRHIRLRFTW